MLSPLATLPLQLACQILVSQNDSSLVNFQFDTRAAPLPKLATELPDGYTVFRDIGVAYKIYETKIPWNSARKYCEADGANLAIIDSYGKIEHIQRIRHQKEEINVGFHRWFDKDEWTNVKNGLAATGLPWATASSVSDMSRRCMALGYLDGSGLFASDCTTLKPFICEVPIL